MHMAKHSKLSFSSRYRWRKCPASVALSVGVPGTSSPAAEEGTAAHVVKEHYMRQWQSPARAEGVEAPDQLVPVGLDLKGRTPGAWNDELRQHGRAYVAAMTEIIGEIGEARVAEEQRVAASSLHPALFGTADTLMWAPESRTLVVSDYKYGFRDVAVGTAEEPNPQLAAYAVAAAEQLATPVARIHLVVVQPRVPLRDPVRKLWITDAPAWLERERALLRAEALATEVPSEPVPGDHCRYCPAKARCPATLNAVAVGLQRAAGTVDLLSLPTDEILALYASRSAFKAFFEDIEERVAQLAAVGHPRVTVTESKGRQMWADPKKAALTLMALGRLDLLQPVALSDALPALPSDVRDELVTRSKSSRTIKIVDAPAAKETAKMFAKYA